MKSEHGRQQPEAEPYLLRIPGVAGRSTWHSHFSLNLLWGQATTAATLYSPLQLCILLNAHVSSGFWWWFLGKERCLHLGIPKTLKGFEDCTLYSGTELDVTQCSGILTPLHRDSALVWEGIWKGHLMLQYAVTNKGLTWQNIHKEEKDKGSWEAKRGNHCC